MECKQNLGNITHFFQADTIKNKLIIFPKTRNIFERLKHFPFEHVRYCTQVLHLISNVTFQILQTHTHIQQQTKSRD